MSNDYDHAPRRARFLGIRVRVRGKRSFRLPLPPIALDAFHYLFLSLTPLFSLFGGKYGKIAKAGLDSADALLLGFMAAGPEEFANIDVRDGKNHVVVRIRLF